MNDPAFSSAWSALNMATTTRSPFNFLQFATIGIDGSPQLRTIVLRRCDTAGGTLSFVTDVRSPKVAELVRDDRVTMLGYDPEKSHQLRLSGRAAIVTGEGERREVWEALRSSTKIMFASSTVPSMPIWQQVQTSEVELVADSVDPYSRYALVKVVVDRMEILELSTDPHQRQTFLREEGSWKSYFLAP